MYGHPGAAGQNGNSDHGWAEGASPAYRPWEGGVAYAQNTNDPFPSHNQRSSENAYQKFSPPVHFRSFSQGSVNTAQENSAHALGNTVNYGYSSGVGQTNHARMFLDNSGQHGTLGNSLNGVGAGDNYTGFDQRYHNGASVNGGYGGHSNERYDQFGKYAAHAQSDFSVNDGYSARTDYSTEYRSEAGQHGGTPHGNQHYGGPGAGFVQNREEEVLQPICKQTCSRDLAPHVVPYKAIAAANGTNIMEAEDMFLIKLIFRSDGEQLFHTKCVTRAFGISKGRLMRLQKRRAQMAIEQVEAGESGTDSLAGHGLVGRRSNNSKRPETLEQFFAFVREHRVIDHWDAPGKPIYRLHASIKRVQGDHSDSLRAQFNTWQRKLSTLEVPRESISSGTAQAWFKKYFKDTLSPCISALSHVNPNNPATVPPPLPKPTTTGSVTTTTPSIASSTGNSASAQSSPVVVSGGGGGRRKKSDAKRQSAPVGKKRRSQEHVLSPPTPAAAAGNHHHHAKAKGVSAKSRGGVVSGRSTDSLGSGVPTTGSDSSLNLEQMGSAHQHQHVTSHNLHNPHVMNDVFNDQLAVLAASMAVAAGVKVQTDILRGVTTLGASHAASTNHDVPQAYLMRQSSLTDKSSVLFQEKTEPHTTTGVKSSFHGWNEPSQSPPSSTDSTTDEREPGGGKIPARRRRMGGVGGGMRRGSPESEVSSRDSNSSVRNSSVGTEGTSEDSWDIRSPGLD